MTEAFTTPEELCEFLDIEFARVIEQAKTRADFGRTEFAGSAAGMIIKTGLQLAADHGAPERVMRDMTAGAIGEAYLLARVRARKG